MFDILALTKALLKHDSIENLVFWLHYRTPVFLIIFATFIASKQQFGKPMNCAIDAPTQPDFADDYCWVKSTFTLPNNLYGESLVNIGNLDAQKNNGVQYHNYYQFVAIVLLIQAAVFYLPRMCWKRQEGKLLHSLIMDLNSPVVNEENLPRKIRFIVNHIVATKGNNNCYAMQFYFWEIFNFLHVGFQAWVMQHFLGFKLENYFVEALNSVLGHPRDYVSTIDAIFPKVTLCTMTLAGTTGRPTPHSGVCILPLNLYNEVFYQVMLFWFILLVLISCMQFMRRFVLLLIPEMHRWDFYQKTKLQDRQLTNEIYFQVSFGTRFLITQLAAEINPLIFPKIMTQLAVELNKPKTA